MEQENLQNQITTFFQTLEKNNFFYAVAILEKMEQNEKNQFLIGTLYSYFWDKLGSYLLKQIHYSRIEIHFQKQPPISRINKDQMKNQYQTFLKEKNPRIVGSIPYEQLEEIKNFLKTNDMTNFRIIGGTIIFLKKTKAENMAKEINLLLHNITENNTLEILNQLNRIIEKNPEENVMLYTLLGYYYYKNEQKKESMDALKIASFLLDRNFRLDDLYFKIETLRRLQQAEKISSAKEKAEKHYPTFLTRLLTTEDSIPDILNSFPIEEQPLILAFLVKDLYLTRLESQAINLSKKIEQSFSLTEEAKCLLEHISKQKKLLQAKGEVTELSKKIELVLNKLKRY